LQKLHLREQNLDFGDGLSYNLHTRTVCVKSQNSISDSTMSLRDFGVLAAGGLSLVASMELEGQIPAGPPLAIAEWSYFWVGVPDLIAWLRSKLGTVHSNTDFRGVKTGI
jgi:hypothetical protein